MKLFKGTPRLGASQIWKFQNFQKWPNRTPDVFFIELISTIKICMFAKKLQLRILKFDQMVDIFAIFVILKFFEIFDFSAISNFF